MSVLQDEDLEVGEVYAFTRGATNSSSQNFLLSRIIAISISTGERFEFFDGVDFDFAFNEEAGRYFGKRLNFNFEVALIDLESSWKEIRPVKLNAFRKLYERNQHFAFKVDVRLDEGYVASNYEIVTSCPVCNASFAHFYLRDELNCAKCSGSFLPVEGEEHPGSSFLFKLRLISNRSEFEFDHHHRKNSVTYEQAKKFISLYPLANGEQKKFCASLLSFERAFRPDLIERYNAATSSSLKTTLEQIGYIVELASLAKKVSGQCQKFNIAYNYKDHRVAIFLFAANLVRHHDEKDLELVDTMSYYVSTGPRNAVFNLKDWEYKTFVTICQKLNGRDVRKRASLAAHLSQIVSQANFRTSLNEVFKQAVEQEAKRLKIPDILKIVPWYSDLLPSEVESGASSRLLGK